jgi:hypothetical protein
MGQRRAASVGNVFLGVVAVVPTWLLSLLLHRVGRCKAREDVCFLGKGANAINVGNQSTIRHDNSRIRTMCLLGLMVLLSLGPFQRFCEMMIL